MNEYKTIQYAVLKDSNQSFKRRYKAFKILRQYLGGLQREVLTELAKHYKNDYEAQEWIETYEAIEPEKDECHIIVEMIEFEKQRLLDALPEKIKFKAKCNLIHKLRNS